MKFRGDYGEFGICDFCDGDSSSQEVYAIGNKGICSKCLEQLRVLLEIAQMTSNNEDTGPSIRQQIKDQDDDNLWK